MAEVAQKRWVVNELPSEHDIVGMQNAINASAPVATLLLQRGIRDFDAAKRFFNPDATQLHSPLLMKDMDKAVDRISRAIESDENILVYGDYDVDGTTSVALLYSFLLERYERVSFYIPDRYAEGYGISKLSIEFARDNDISLIIALDCGIKANEEVALANEFNIDFIICDHHLPGENLPEAHSILNPLQDGCDYPYKYLSGCGIGFKLISGLAKAWDENENEAFAYLDLVAIAAACDIVPMTGENRVLCHLGLKMMGQAIRPGLVPLLESGGRIKDGMLKRALNISDLVFVIGPRINAAGRMKHGEAAVNLLISKTTKSAQEPANDIIKHNLERREVDSEMVEEAIEMMADLDAERSSTVLFASHWHKGVVGIVASRVQDYAYKPTIILTESDGKATGSARSVLGFDVHSAIESCSDLLETYGGHKAAAGLTMDINNLEEFKKRFESFVSSSINPEMLIPSIEIDMELDLCQINERMFETILRIAPYGPQNMRPVFVCHNLKDTGKSRCVGDGSHLKVEAAQLGDPKNVMKGIAFGLGKHQERMSSGETFSLVFNLEWNEFNGYKNIEMMVRDIRFTGV